ncbi:MAG: phosphoribosylglycinamide formyltransferase [Gammaproteobacteria bacterium]|nr:MAG: phosphoribosylglycinamide formyltransferase [Gammaproteobacteria bacterium]
MIRLGILGSTRGTNLGAIVEAIQQNKLAAAIRIVISNKPDAGILQRAQAYGLTTQFISPKDLTREVYDQAVTALLQQHEVDLVVLIGYMRILSVEFVHAWERKIINVHPSLLPAFAGKMDLEVHRAVLEAGVSETGCTVHEVTEEVDAGPILVQQKCSVLTGDTPEILKQRVQQLEGGALVAAILKKEQQ